MCTVVLLADSFAMEVMMLCTLGISEGGEGDSFTLHRGYIRKEQGVPAAFCQSHRKKLILHNGIFTTVTEGDFQNSSKKLTPREGLKEGNPIPQWSRQGSLVDGSGGGRVHSQLRSINLSLSL